MFGPVLAGGGTGEVEATVGHVWTLARVGTLDPLVKHVIRDGVQRYAVTEADAAARSARRSEGGGDPPEPASCQAAAACREAASCTECVKLRLCGWSFVRRRCFVAHPIATESGTCHEEPAASRPLAEWLRSADRLLDPDQPGYGPTALRAAYRMLERAVESAAAAGDSDSLVAAAVARDELAPKLEAVFDDEDARDLLAATRHSQLAAVHPQMPAVVRRTLNEALEYVARGEPVVITDMFAAGDEGFEGLAEAHPVLYKWTLAYLNRSMASGLSQKGAAEPTVFNVASDVQGACCQYYEPRKVAIQAGYPYPFRPHTHLYRDTFDGFSRTLRAAARERAAAEHSGAPATAAATTLHYLHETVMAEDGEPKVAGEAAPPGLAEELSATAQALLPVARLQPFFQGIAAAKLWIGQRGVVLPLHYDSTDNLYVMAWGRKRAVLAEPGQLDALYRYPNAHPHVGSTQVNISAPDLARHPHFARAKLREVVVGPGDVLYLPGHWWHQFEQPFEATASLNVWTKERPGTSAQERDARIRGIALYDHMESSVVKLFGKKVGVVLESLARASLSSEAVADRDHLARANETLHAAAGQWRNWVVGQQGGHAEALPAVADLVAEFLELGHRDALGDARWPGWRPGKRWDMSGLTPLPHGLRARCKAAHPKATFASVCGAAP